MKKILIVDDHADIRKLIRMTLEFEDYDIYEAETGEKVNAIKLPGDGYVERVALDLSAGTAADDDDAVGPAWCRVRHGGQDP